MGKALQYFYANATDDELDKFFELLNDFMRRVEERKEVIDFMTDGGNLNLNELIKERMEYEGLSAEESKYLVEEELIVNRLLEE